MRSFVQKSLIAILLVGSLTIAGTGSVRADSAIPVIINGKVQQFDQSPVMVNNRMLVPMRAIFEALGAQVNWSPSAPNLVTATKGDTTIILTIGSNTASKNGQAVQLDVPAKIINNRTYVPIRFVSESLGADVKWDNATRTVQIQTSSGTNGSGEQDLTVQQVGVNSKSVVLIEMFDQSGQEIASGSGFAVSSDGKIITNYHVIEGAASAKVIFPDNSTYTTTKVLLADPKQDLAELKIDATNLPALTLGDSSQVQLGESVVAIGSPQGLQNTLSTGVVSTVARDDGNGHTYIQITAPIDHGSSGGALFDMHGDVIGVTSYGYESTANLNLAIPSNVVKQFLQGTETPQDISSLPTKLSLSEMKDYLNTNYGTISYQNHAYHFDFETEYADDGVSMNIYAFMSSVSEYDDLGQLEATDSHVVPDILLEILKDTHSKGAVNPLVIIMSSIELNQKVQGYPDSEFTPQDGGGYILNHEIGSVLLDDSTGTAKVRVEPDFNGNQYTTVQLW